jgi:ParB/RepB/Spo0J family partition protein
VIAKDHLIVKILPVLYKGDMDTKATILLEFHCLEMRYAHLRVQSHQVIENLALSIERYGQLQPVVVIPEATHQWILIDGYHRVRALKRLGKDTVEAEVWDCDIREALVMMLKRHSGRTLGIFEEALFLYELYSQHGLCQNVLANRTGRDQSWISRRLSLVEHLPCSILKALSQGAISLWVCERVLAPMARAIPEHAQCLLEHLLKHPRKTREIQLFYEHYQKSNHQARTRMLDDPDLFFKAQRLLATQKQAAFLKKGPEGQWRLQCRDLATTLSALKGIAPTVFYRQAPKACFDLLGEFEEAVGLFGEVTDTIRRSIDVNPRSAPDDPLPS